MHLKFPQSSFRGVAEMFSPFGPPCGCFAVELVCGGCNAAALHLGEMPYMAQSCSLELDLLMNIQIIVQILVLGGKKILEGGLWSSALRKSERLKGLCNLVLKLACPHYSANPKKDLC